MSRKDIIFFAIVFIWQIAIMIEVLFFPTFAVKYGIFFNLIPIVILFIIMIPRLFLEKYNNWLESNLTKIIPTSKEIRLKKLKRINRYKNFIF